MLTIRISGPRGEGKTTTAIEIARLLIRQGHDVAYHQLPRSVAREATTEGYMQGLPQDVNFEERQILIVDVCDDELRSQAIAGGNITAYNALKAKEAYEAVLARPETQNLATWIVGQVKDPTWEFVGVFDDECKAVAACRDATYWVAPWKLNCSAPHETTQWPVAYYPLLPASPDTAAGSHAAGVFEPRALINGRNA